METLCSSMYLLDWKIPKRLNAPVEFLYARYTENHPCLKPRQEDALKKAIQCFVYNAAYSIKHNQPLMDFTLDKTVYSKPLVYNCNSVNRKVSHRYTKLFVEWLDSIGMVKLHKGSVLDFNTGPYGIGLPTTKRSYVELCNGLQEVLLGSIENVPVDINKSVLEMRDSNGDTIPKRLSGKQRELISLLEAYNLNSQNQSIELDGVDYFLSSKKVFNNNSWTEGGRTYLLGAKITTELLKRTNRPRITINKEPTVELDYKFLHLALIAELEGLVFDQGFDPYQIEIYGYDSYCLRQLAKVATLCLVNASSTLVAQRAFNWEINRKHPIREWKQKGLIPDPISSKLVVERVIERNSYACSWFGEGRGLYLQHLDSLIMDYCLDWFTQRNILILPLHDGIIVPKKYEEDCYQVMVDSYQHVVQSKNNCYVEVK